MLVQETYVEKEMNCLVGEAEPYEPYTEDIGRLFRSMQREHGRCVSSVYVDTNDGKAMRVGWVFEKRRKYSDSSKTYLSETWVTLFEKWDKRTVIDCEYVSLA